jgi:hypothetical protein
LIWSDWPSSMATWEDESTMRFLAAPAWSQSGSQRGDVSIQGDKEAQGAPDKTRRQPREELKVRVLNNTKT